MNCSPRPEKEIRSGMVLSPGIYDFEIVKATEKVSKNNNEMIELEVRVFSPDGTPRLLRDWLVSGSDLGELKINRFCHCVGLQDTYFSGTLNAFDCEGMAGKLRLTVEGSERFGDQNRVKDYIVAKSDASQVDESLRAFAPTELQAPVASGADIPF